MYKNAPGCFLDLFKGLGVSKDKNNWFLGSGHVPKNPKIEMMSFGLSHKQIDKLLYQIEAE